MLLIISFYDGILHPNSAVSNLAIPKLRPPNINTFKELVDREDVIVIGNSHNSFMEYLQQSKDSVMMVCWKDLFFINVLIVINSGIKTEDLETGAQ